MSSWSWRGVSDIQRELMNVAHSLRPTLRILHLTWELLSLHNTILSSYSDSFLSTLIRPSPSLSPSSGDKSNTGSYAFQTASDICASCPLGSCLLHVSHWNECMENTLVHTRNGRDGGLNMDSTHYSKTRLRGATVHMRVYWFLKLGNRIVKVIFHPKSF